MGRARRREGARRGARRERRRERVKGLGRPDSESSSRGNRTAGKLLNEAIGLANSGKTDQSLIILGQAMHTAEDVIAHRGLGNVIVNVAARLSDHKRQDNSLRTQDPEQAKEARPDPVASGAIQKLLGMVVMRYVNETGRNP
jgi:hypothetical protein